MSSISKTVWILSLISLFTDTASEMLYPVMPVFLKSIGFSVLLIGILEGIAEAVAGLSKGYFGKMSDLSGKRVPFVQLGYLLSALSKPMMALWTKPILIFTARTTDRLGKGIRTAARDAILSDESNEGNKGKIFGFHRSMDTIGAVAGPLFSLLYLLYHPGDYRSLFMLAIIPGLISIAFTLLLKENKKAEKSNPIRIPFLQIFSYWKDSNPEFKRVITGLLCFALINSSDVFLLLKASQAGIEDQWLIGIYIFYNLVFALCAYPMGILADKIGLKTMFIFGLCIFAIVYMGIGMTENASYIYVFFALYGIYAAATDGISKAWISKIADKKDTATALGTYTGLQSISALLASTLAGLLWYKLGSMALFLFSSIASVLIAVYFITLKPVTDKPDSNR